MVDGDTHIIAVFLDFEGFPTVDFFVRVVFLFLEFVVQIWQTFLHMIRLSRTYMSTNHIKIRQICLIFHKSLLLILLL